MPGKIFVNERRGDNTGFARALFGRLKQAFSGWPHTRRREAKVMNRKVQGVLLGTGIVATIVGILAGANAGGVSHCSTQFPKWLGCVLSTHEGLAGGLIGAGGAIFAGWLAWSGVRDQIQSQRELSTARERDNLAAILAEMRDLFDALSEVWRAIDFALLPNQSAEHRGNRIAIASSLLPALPRKNQIDDLKDFTDELAKEIAPTKRGQFIRVWQSIDWIYRAISEEREAVPAGDDGRFRLQLIRVHLSHFERYLSVLDEPAGRVFASRMRSEVDHRGIAAQIRPMVDKAERGEGP